MFKVFAGIVALSALLSFLNKRYLKLPDTIGVMILAMLLAFLIGTIQLFNLDAFMSICSVIRTVDFREILFEFLLGFLLFAGAIHVHLNHLLDEKRAVMIFATVGVIASTFLVGSGLYVACLAFGLGINFITCLVFGALISPTDPVAVLALLKKAGAPSDVEIKVVGESLFNDGVGIVVFLSLVMIANSSNTEINLVEIAEAFAVEGLGGMLMGAILGWIGIQFLKYVNDSPIIAVHITLAIVMGGYALSQALGISGALAMVVAGLIIGNRLSKKDVAKELKRDMNTFWKVLDEIMNSILFVLIGLEVVALKFDVTNMMLGLIGIGIVLIARYISVIISSRFVSKKHRSNHSKLLVLTWAGLRGGISVALALSLPETEYRELIIFITYVIVAFSIIVQGLSIEKVTKSLLKAN